MSAADVLKIVKEKNIKFIDIRFTDMCGQMHHVTMPTSAVQDSLQEWLKKGRVCDGSSMLGWREINNSDMLLMPDTATAKIDPFFDEPTLFITCDVIDPNHAKAGYDRCPRTIAKRAEAYLRSFDPDYVGYFGPELEFFVFDSVTWRTNMSGTFVKIESEEAAWSSGKSYEGANTGHRPNVKGGYYAMPPVDSGHDLRSAILLAMEEMGIHAEVHHHEVGTAGQSEVASRFSTLTERADWTQISKYIVRNVAHHYGKTATFMPKPIVGDNGSGMHIHQSLWKKGKNLFAGDKTGGLSDIALYYIGGIIKHARALNAITNPGTNSYKRLVPHYEAPVKLAYALSNRSAAIRIPYATSANACRVEVRFPDALSNPYLCFSALLLAGLDGIKQKIHPGAATSKNLYTLTAEEDQQIPTVCASLEEALGALAEDHAFLLEGGVFSQDFIDTYIKVKTDEVNLLRTITHPIEFEMYYSL